MAVAVNQLAPDFTLFADNDQPVTLSQLKGHKVILFFYPKDSTPGCTMEACDFRNTLPSFEQVNAKVFGISRDSVASHKKFKQKQQLSYMLLADEQGKVCDEYGVLVKKNMFGIKFHGIERSTFLIDEQGLIKSIWRKVKVKGHVNEVLTCIKTLA